MYINKKLFEDDSWPNSWWKQLKLSFLMVGSLIDLAALAVEELLALPDWLRLASTLACVAEHALT